MYTRQYLILIALLILLPSYAMAHGTITLCGEVEAKDNGELCLRLSIGKGSLGFYADKHKGYNTWGQLKQDSKRMEQIVKKAIKLHTGNEQLMADTCVIRALNGKYAPSDDMKLPDEVQLTLSWKKAPKGAHKLTSNFEHTSLHVQLKLNRESNIDIVSNIHH
ncbi:MAG: hypothetical protein HQL32_00490 [Planctomycetes bacterium]|nr:hypothetical protein [Planctomycetota bacterium]